MGIKRNNDKRFKKDDKIEAGVLQEYERIEKYTAALKEFEGYLADGTVTLTHLQVKDSTGKVYKEGNFAVNLCPEGGKTEKLKEQVYYYTEDNAKTAKNMHVMFFDLAGVEDSFEYESLIYVNEVIKAALPEPVNG